VSNTRGAGRKLRKALRIALAALAALFLAAQLIQPERENPPPDPALAVRAHVEVPAEVESILRRACLDCHSYETRWPWYSRVAPASWLVAEHVRHGRTHLNFSHWPQWAHGTREDFQPQLEAICEQVSAGHMPLPSYLLVHRRARLSEEDVRRLCDWTRDQRERLSRRR